VNAPIVTCTCGKRNRLPLAAPGFGKNIVCGACKGDLGHAAKHAYEEAWVLAGECDTCGADLTADGECPRCDTLVCDGCGADLNADGDCPECDL
jgi:hypothetical protein